jgi:hypothetical protein
MIRRGTHRFALLPGALLLFLAAGCGSPSGPGDRVASVDVTPAGPAVLVGGTVQLTATPRDASGAAVTGVTVSWQSESTGVASVSGTGLVTGVAAGTSRITATAGGRSGSVTATVSEPSPVQLTSISPATLQPGITATITGEGFLPSPGGNTVTIAGFAATVTAATATSLTIAVPQTVCAPSGNVAVRVVVGTGQGQRAHPWAGGAPLQLNVGQQARLDPATAYCIQLANTSGAYLVGVQSVTPIATSLTQATVRGTIAEGAQEPLPTFRAPSWPGATSLPQTAAQRRWARHREAELQLRLAEQQLVASMPPSALRRSAEQAAMAAAAPPGVGDTVDMKYPRRPNLCVDFTPVRAVVRAVGQRAIWMEDLQNPAGGYTAADYTALGAQFDGDIWSANVEYFGEPTDFDSNGRIIILVTKEVNRDSILGRVVFADLVPDQCPTSSNGGEVFYGIAPDSGGAFGFKYAVADARLDAPVIIAHELTHVIQFGRRLITPLPRQFQTIWELEGQATLAEEVVGHRVTGRQPRQNYGFDVAWNSPQTTPIWWYRSPFIDLALYFGFETSTTSLTGAPEQCGWLDRPVDGSMGPCLGGRSLYGVSWSFLRWISDHFGPGFPGGEQGLHRALVQDTESGFTTITRLTGQPIDLLLAQWSAALYVDDRIAGANERLTLPSWDLQNIANRLVEPARLRPRERGLSFSDDVSVRAGSTAYFRITAAGSSPGAIAVTGPAAGALPSHMRVWVVRLQ